VKDHSSRKDERLLEINLDGMIGAKAGSVVSDRGQIRFERVCYWNIGSPGGLVKKALTGDGASLMKASGKGKLYLEDEGKEISCCVWKMMRFPLTALII